MNCMSENLFDEHERDGDKQRDTNSNVNVQDDSTISVGASNEANSGYQVAKHGYSYNTHSLKLYPVSWRDCQNYFRKKYPSCETCEKGHKYAPNMRRHITLQHCSEEAIKLFGKSNTCAVCKKFSVRPRGHKNGQIHQVKCHMKAHLELFFPDEEGRNLLLRAKKFHGRKSISHLQECQDYFSNKYPDCQVCNKGHDRSDNLRQHLVFMHYSKLAIKRFGIDTTCLICKKVSVDPLGSQSDQQILSHMAWHLEDIIEDKTAISHLINVMVKSESPPSDTVEPQVKDNLDECEKYFRDKYPTCKTCHVGHNRPEFLRRHLVNVHYSRTAIKEFGIGITCSICNKFSIKPGGALPMHQIKSHMAWHLEDIVEDQEARYHLVNMVVNVKVNAKTDKSGLRVKSKRSMCYQECEEYFRNKHRSCQTCKNGHTTISKMKKHLVFRHYGEEAIKVFGSGGTCSVCQNFSINLTTQEACYGKSTQIKCHMSTHLEHFISDEKGRDLLLKVKA